MSYKKTNDTVIKLVDEELKMAAEQFGKVHASPHEGYAVLLEEYEEAIMEMELAAASLDDLWNAIKENDDANTVFYAETLKTYCIRLICEAVQAAAMAQKLIDTIGDLERKNA